MRTVFAKFIVDASSEDEAIDIVEEQSNSFQQGWYDEAIAIDRETDDLWAQYIEYLCDWAFKYSDSQYEGNSPMTFEQYSKDNGDW